MSGNLKRLLWIMIALAASDLSLAGMYKWTDDSGQIHYSDAAPADQKAQALNPQTSLPSGVDEEKAKLDKQVETFNKQRDERLKQEEEAKKKAAAEKQREQQCKTLRNNLQLYLTKNRVAHKEGDKVVVTPYEERLKEIEKIQKQMEKACAGF